MFAKKLFSVQSFNKLNFPRVALKLIGGLQEKWQSAELWMVDYTLDGVFANEAAAQNLVPVFVAGIWIFAVV